MIVRVNTSSSGRPQDLALGRTVLPQNAASATFRHRQSVDEMLTQRRRREGLYFPVKASFRISLSKVDPRRPVVAAHSHVPILQTVCLVYLHATVFFMPAIVALFRDTGHGKSRQQTVLGSDEPRFAQHANFIGYRFRLISISLSIKPDLTIKPNHF